MNTTLAQESLNLRCIQLKTAQEWTPEGGQLSFIFPKAGDGKFLAGSVFHRLACGDVLVLNASWTGSKLTVHNSEELIFWCFSLRLDHLFPLFASAEISLLQHVTDGFKSAKLYPAESELALECHQLLASMPAQFNLEHRSQLLRVAAAILTVEFRTAQSRRVGFVRPEEHMIQVFEKLSAVEFLNFSVGELAERFGCSRRHLNRLFHHYFGVSVAALRMEMRLLKAVSLLRNPEAKIIHVAEACGFNQQGLFNICFKRRFGASPGQWRRLNLQAESLPAHLDTDAVACPLRSNGLCPWSRNSCVDDNAAPASVSPAPKQGPARFLIQTNGSSAKASRQHDNGQTRIPAGNQGRDDLRVRP